MGRAITHMQITIVDIS